MKTSGFNSAWRFFKLKMIAKKIIKPAAVSCIIPFYNEGGRISRVLKEVSRVKNISQIICVDDGSRDNAGKTVKKQFSAVKILRLKKNQGKSAAVKNGVKAAKGEIILLLDADLKKFQAQELERAINIFISLDADLLVLRQKKAIFYQNLFSKISLVDVLVSGQRLLKKSDLLKIFKKKIAGYLLEVAINAYMLKKHKKTYWMDYQGVNVTKIEKEGFLRGAEKSWKMINNIIAYLGLAEFLGQTKLFKARKVVQVGRGKKLKLKIV
jgi:glycosyltransferase involved in cell wall biosynthesis